jgi:sortase A
VTAIGTTSVETVTDQLVEHSGDGDAARSTESAHAPENESRYRRWRRTRVSRWDRPKPPKDWRYFVGGLGKILIVIGLLMFGFVAYQLWGTGIETARAQNRLEKEFAQLVDDEATTATTFAPDDTSPVATTRPPSDTTTPPSTTSGSSPSTTVRGAGEPIPAVEQDIPPIEPGQPIARLEIPRIGKQGDDALYVVPGVTVSDLKKGPGHYPDTPLPGQLGNAAIAGHRTTYGEPFRHVDELEPGDEIVVTMLTGERFVYEVTSTEIVSPDDYYVVTTRDPTVAELTLTSCHPEYSARERIAVHALLNQEKSAAVGQPTYYDLEATPSAADDDTTGEDPTISQPSSDAGSSAEESSESIDAGVAPTTTPPSAEVEDAFGEGWFHDNGAWLQIAIWGAALIAIVICIRMISRRTRHDSIGIAAGIIPFVICLYFFYQNVNRLLPPGF